MLILDTRYSIQGSFHNFRYDFDLSYLQKYLMDQAKNLGILRVSTCAYVWKILCVYVEIYGCYDDKCPRFPKKWLKFKKWKIHSLPSILFMHILS
jgi:hypothetical protein